LTLFVMAGLTFERTIMDARKSGVMGVLLGILLPAGCQTYTPKPLEPESLLALVEKGRRSPDTGTGRDGEEGRTPSEAPAFTFSRAAELMSRNGPALKETRAEYETALALAKIKTPLPNPALEAGPQFGFGPDARSYRLQPFGSIGFTIPLGGRLGAQDELNRLNAEVARIEVQARHRELYLELRRLYARWTMSHARLKIREEMAASAGQSMELGRKLAEGGRLSALEVGLLEVEFARIQAETLNVQSDIVNQAGDLSLAVGVHADHFLPLPADALPVVPAAAPDLKALRERLTANHPELGRLRARYEAAEGELRLEIARQYPDFSFGPSVDKEVGERKTVLGLTLGIELPIFDQNQQGIAVASQRREEIRAKYESAANRALASLERARQKVRVAAEKTALVTGRLLPKAQANLELARKALNAGATDALHYLEAERGMRTALIEALDSEQDLRAAWGELERAAGHPLFTFPGEKSADVPVMSLSSEDSEESGKE
jgi:cobalt-zinc-cadmium efflux system outer membrane protein